MKKILEQLNEHEFKIQWFTKNKQKWFEILEEMRSIDGLFYDRTYKYRTCPINEENIKKLEDMGFEIPKKLKVVDTDNWSPPWNDINLEKYNVPKYLRPYQVEAMKFLIYRKGRGLISDEMGCVFKHTMIQISKGKYNFKITIEDLYNEFKDCVSHIYAKSLKDGNFRMHKIKNVLFQGKQKVCRIETESGKSLIATNDHPLMNKNNKWVALKDLNIGDFVIVNDGKFLSLMSTIPKAEKIIKKELLKEKEDVYDIVMEDPYRNFVANGIVVHNSGKTIMALGFLKMLKSLPALIVVPATIKRQWMKQFKNFVNRKSRVEILYGRTPYKLKKNTTYIINWDILTYWKSTLKEMDFKLLIGDEIHRISNKKSLRSKALSMLAKKIKYFIPMSGTPIKSRPKQFYPVLYLLAPKIFNNEWRYLNRYCDPTFTGFGMVYNGATHINELHNLVRNLMLRRELSELLPDLPDKQISIIPLDTKKDKKQYQSSLEKFKKATGINEKQEFNNLKLEAFALKQDFIVDWLKDFISNDKKIIIGTYHRKVIQFLQEKFKKECVIIYGGVSEKQRDKVIDKFINDRNCMILFGQILSMGEGIDGLQNVCNNVAYVEFAHNPSDHDQFTARLRRSGQKNNVNEYWLIAEGTIEDDMIEALDQKRGVFDALVNGRDTKKTNFINYLKAKYKETI
jgi:SNF2 family DNA or RNA helicase